MRRITAVVVDNNFAPGQTGIAVGAADDETAGGVDENVFVLRHPAVWDIAGDVFFCRFSDFLL